MHSDRFLLSQNPLYDDDGIALGVDFEREVVVDAGHRVHRDGLVAHEDRVSGVGAEALLEAAKLDREEVVRVEHAFGDAGLLAAGPFVRIPYFENRHNRDLLLILFSKHGGGAESVRARLESFRTTAPFLFSSRRYS